MKNRIGRPGGMEQMPHRADPELSAEALLETNLGTDVKQ